MFLSAFRVLNGYFRLFNRYLCAMLLVSVAGANAAGAPAAAVPLLPAELSTLVTAAIRNHPTARSAQAKRRAASQAMTLRIEQTLWDNGAGDSRISAIATTADISALQVTLEQQDLAVQTINAWEAMLSAQRRLNAANVTVTVIEGFKAQMTRRVDSKASPTIDLALVEARLLQTQVERLAATNGLQRVRIRYDLHGHLHGGSGRRYGASHHR